MLRVVLSLIAALSLQACERPTSAVVQGSEQLFFDDFSYASVDEMTASGWQIRQHQGHPGVAGARWSAQGVKLDNEAGLLLLQASTNGVNSDTEQVQICHQRKYLYGTYAARVFFRDTALGGEQSDQVVQTFYANSPYIRDFDPDFSEIDFEYLPNGGWWAGKDPALWVTTWETFAMQPWQAVNLFERQARSYAGWRVLVITVNEREVSYYVDGELFARHGDTYVPEVAMSLNFNQWFTDIAFSKTASDTRRIYQHDVDWVLHIADENLSPDQVVARIEQLRQAKLSYTDTVADRGLANTCNL